MSDWISVKDSLPEEYRDCLCTVIVPYNEKWCRKIVVGIYDTTDAKCWILNGASGT